MSSKKSIAVVVAVLLAVALLGWWLVAADDPEDAAAPQPSASSTSDPTDSSASPSPDATDEPAEPVSPKPVKKAPTLTEPAPLADGAEARVTQIETVRSSAELPGEISAPALRFTIEATAGDRPLDLGPVVVNAYFGAERTPAIAVGRPGAKPFTGRVKPGESVTGVYVFNVPVAERDLVRLEFSWSPDRKPVILTGNVT